MPEMFSVLPPKEALQRFLAGKTRLTAEIIATAAALGRVLAEAIVAPTSLPDFPRSTMDGYAVCAEDTFGATESMPAYLAVVGEVPMGKDAGLTLAPGQAAVVFTGGMIPNGADAVVMIERTQQLDCGDLEVLRAVAPGENVINIGDDIQAGEQLFAVGHALRPQDLGGLMALGITCVKVARQPRVAIISTGDEVVAPDQQTAPGQIRDINSYSIAGLVTSAGGIPVPVGIVGDEFEQLHAAARSALDNADLLVISAGSSVSTRDLTAAVINSLGAPGVLVHGIALRPGKPTILGRCNGKPVIGLPGNPVSAFVVAKLFLTPLLHDLQGLESVLPQQRLTARISHNIPSVPGREDYIQVRLIHCDGQLRAEPIFGKSNLIYTLIQSDGMVCIPLDNSGLYQGQEVEVELF